MNDFYELLPRFRLLTELCHARNFDLDPEFGDRVAYQGRAYVVAAAETTDLALIDEWCGIPLREDQIVYVNDWRDDPSCVFLPGIDLLLQMIRRISGIFPSFTPGIHKSREVWQISHPNADPIISRSLHEALLELTIRIISESKEI